MTIGFMVIQEDGTPIFSYVQESQQEVTQILLPSLLGVLQSFSKGMLGSIDSSSIKSVTLKDTVYTIINLNVKTPSRKENLFHFVLLTDTKKKSSDIEASLEFLMTSFLSFKKGEFVVKMRINATNEDEFSEFCDFLSSTIDLNSGEIRKTKITPPPGSFIQGMLNEVRGYYPTNIVETWNPKLVSLGNSYVWVSEDLTKREEDEILERIRTNLSSGLFDTIEARVRSQLEA
ncbi:MAG: hypothetical protein P1Q69_15605 [Candidatus Thorarchaeota archaeon]|nr:hypothetical protein [Candidatus Thorarchaeota archaeon]